MKSKIVNLFFSIVVSLTILFRYDYFDFTYNLFYLILFLFLFVYILIYYFLISKLFSREKGVVPVSLLFSFCSAIGKLYAETGSLYTLISFENIFFFIVSLIGFYVYFSIMLRFICLLYFRIEKSKLKSIKINEYFNKRTFLISFVLVFLSLIIYFIVYYPTTINTDPMLQLSQYVYSIMGHTKHIQEYEFILNLSNHYPIAHTMIIGTFLRVGRYLINDNFGLFAYIFLQGVFFSLTCARSIVFFKKRNIKNRYLYIALFIYMTCPMYGFYIMDLNKDVLYAILMMNFVMNIFNYIEDRTFTLKRFFSWFLILISISLLRNNGIYITMLTLPFVMVYLKKDIKYLLPLYILILFSYYSFTNVLLPRYNVEPSSLKEVLSVPFQQTARNIKYNESDISNKDKKIINKILDYETIKNEYTPYISDPVKNTFKEDSTKKDLINYFKVWFKEGLKNPITYIDATLNNMYGYYYIYSKPSYVYYVEYPSFMYETYDIDYHFTSSLLSRKILKSYADAYQYFPVASLIISIGFNNLMLITLGIFLILKKDSKYLICLLPLYITYLVCDVSPVNYYFRYALPCMFLTPFIIVLFIYIHNKKA